MALVARSEEQRKLSSYLQSGKAEFVVLYGRRRVGKTYLIDEYFNRQYAFQATGLSEGNLADQLAAFQGKLKEFGSDYDTLPGSWFEAFGRLRELLSTPMVHRHKNCCQEWRATLVPVHVKPKL